jgi:hypothetical protein
VAILFELLGEVMEKQRQLGFRLFGVVWKYYLEGGRECKEFVLDNLGYLFRANPVHFPVAQFLSLYEPSPCLQHNEFSLLLAMSQSA